jgi:ketosteroid isomerase-like protein
MTLRCYNATMTPTEIEAIADTFFAAIEQGDIETVATLYEPDATIWHNTDQYDQPTSENLVVLRWMADHLADLHYEVTRRTVAGDSLFQQHVLRATTEQGDDLVVPAILRLEISGSGRVARIEEYLDTAHLAPLQR